MNDVYYRGEAMADWGPLDRLQQEEPKWFVWIRISDTQHACGRSKCLFRAVAFAKHDYEVMMAKLMWEALR